MAKIGRLLTAMVTPFDAEGRVDWPQVRALAKGLVDSGSDGLVVCGTTGEAPSLSHEEKLRMFKETKAAIGDRGAIVAGTGNYNTAESIEMSKEAEKIGVDGLLLTVPYYNKPPQEGLFQHFRAIAGATKLPCILYNVPSRTSVNMTAETTVRLSAIENIAGVKEASSNMDQIAQILSDARKGFLVWSGNDSETFIIMSMGGYGIISVASHVIGKQIKNMMELLLAGKQQEAAAENLRLMPMFKGLFVVTNPIPVKYCTNLVMPVGKPRLPLVPPDEKTAAFLNGLMKKYTIDLPASYEVAMRPPPLRAQPPVAR